MLEKEKYKNIEFLQFVGVMIVAIYHLIVYLKLNYIIFHWGHMWVEFFFILSGFFLFYTTDFKMPTYKFVFKKLARLMPVFIFVYILYNILVHLNLLNYQKYINIYSLFLLSNVGLTAKNTMGNLHNTWFISSLFWSYLFYFYLKNLVSTKWFNFITALLTMFCYVYLTNTLFGAIEVYQNFICVGMLRALGGLGLGYFLYMFIKNTKIECNKLWQKCLFTIIEIYILFQCIYITIFHKISINNPSITVLFFVALIALFLLKQGFVSKCLNNNFCQFLGKYSYSIFISHIIIIDLVKVNVIYKNTDFFINNALLVVLATIVLIILFGIITYHLIEQPCYKYLNQKLNIKKHRTNQQLKISPLGHTWVLDFDGTLVEHNGYKTGEDKFLPGAKEFLMSIPKDDYILILTAREAEAKEKTEKFLKDNGIRYNKIIFEMPMGERILINDDKPSGLRCAYAVTPTRNQGLENFELVIDEDL